MRDHRNDDILAWLLREKSDFIPEEIKGFNGEIDYDKTGKYWVAALDKYQQGAISEDKLWIELRKYELLPIFDSISIARKKTLKQFIYAECDDEFHDPENIIGVVKDKAPQPYFDPRFDDKKPEHIIGLYGVEVPPLVCQLYGCQMGNTKDLYESINFKNLENKYNRKAIQAYMKKVEQVFNLTEDEIMEIYHDYRLESFQKLAVYLRNDRYILKDYSRSELLDIIKNDPCKDVREQAEDVYLIHEDLMRLDVENARSAGPDDPLYEIVSDPNSKLSKWYDAEMEKRETYKQKNVDMDR